MKKVKRFETALTLNVQKRVERLWRRIGPYLEWDKQDFCENLSRSPNPGRDLEDFERIAEVFRRYVARHRHRPVAENAKAVPVLKSIAEGAPLVVPGIDTDELRKLYAEVLAGKGVG